MKRSEMIFQLTQLMVLLDNTYPRHGYVSAAEQVLALIEDRGMLPPKGHARYFYIPEVKTEYTNEWEPE